MLPENPAPSVPKRFNRENYKLHDDSIKAIRDFVEDKLEEFFICSKTEEMVLKKFQGRLDEYMSKKYPDLGEELNKLSLHICTNMKKLEKTIKELEFREKCIVKSDNLTKDVYQMRDEFDKIKKAFEDQSKKIKKAFEL